MSVTKVLVANRAEIAIRVMRAAAELRISTVAVYAEDDSACLHTRRAEERYQLRGRGPSAYLDAAQLIDIAKRSGCDAIHPGYGFLSESGSFARSCADAGITFVGPSPETLALFGDKATARTLAAQCDVPLLPGTSGPTNLEAAADFLESLGEGGAIMIKAIAGGGGRGMRLVRNAGELAAAYERCRSEAERSFGNPEVYVEQFMPRARHIEIQIVGDGSNPPSHLWERECTIQRRNQKIVEFAPSPALSPVIREQLFAAALRMATSVRFASLGTFEFLVDASPEPATPFAFLEVNPRLQVEHTVTEEVTGIDLVIAQLQIAAGKSLPALGLDQSSISPPHGYAVEVRINLEAMTSEGPPKPSHGTLMYFEPPTGPGLRTDTFGYAGYTINPNYDSLLAKLIGHSTSGNFLDAVDRTYRGLCEFRIEGVQSNISFLQNLLKRGEFRANQIYTGFVDDLAEQLAQPDSHQRLHFAPTTGAIDRSEPRAFAGAKVDAVDPLAVLAHGKTQVADGINASSRENGPAGSLPVNAPMQGTIVSIDVADGDAIRPGQDLVVIEAMKMESVIRADQGGIVRSVSVVCGDTVYEGHPLLYIEEANVEVGEHAAAVEMDLDSIRPDLEEVLNRHAMGMDSQRPEVVARRRKTGHRTARENVQDLCDSGSFVEYGPLVIAAQRLRRPVDELIRETPADGLLVGVATVNAALFGDAAARCAVLAYDYTVLAGTQGKQNHQKKDRLFELAEKWRLPVVFFTEGGGGRPGDTDHLGVAGLHCLAFNYFAKLSGLVPLVGITTGRCFAGNAVLLGCCDVIIATEGSNIGVGGPAMIEGGGLGVFRPEEVGPMEVQVPNGVVDIAVKDEAEAVRIARQYLSYFQGDLQSWDCADQRILRSVIPENRLRTYDVRRVIETMADTASMLELRRGFGHGIITALIRIEGKPLGVLANNPMHLAGAIDRDGADKGARFMQLCDAFDIPILFLCDCPGIMVGPEIEKTALVRHASRMFVVGASVTVPYFTIVLRKSYGLGAQAMAGGSFKAPFFAVSWPTGEFGGMGLEGAVKLGYRKELAAIEDPSERKAKYEEMVAQMYQRGKAVNTASHFELDDVIDPMDSRHWIASALRSIPPKTPRTHKKRPCIDTW